MKISETGLRLIKKFESFRAKAYKCPAGVWTIGYGITLNVKEGDVTTIEEAEKKLLSHIAPIEAHLSARTLNQNQFDALVSFCYNVGISAFDSSTLNKVIRKDPNDFKSIKTQFLRWNRGGGKVLSGLILRRNEEFELYSKQIKITIK